MVFFEIPWYRMPVSHQRQMLCVIHDAQNGIVLTVGPFDELDFQMTTTVSTTRIVRLIFCI